MYGHDYIDVDGVARGGGRPWEGRGAGKFDLRSAAGFAACAGTEGGGDAEWQIVTRGKARASGARRSVIKAVQSAMEQNESLQQAAPLLRRRPLRSARGSPRKASTTSLQGWQKLSPSW